MTSIPSSRLVLTDLINQLSALHISTAHPPPTKKAHAPSEHDEPTPPPPMDSLPLPAQDILVSLDYLLPGGICPALDVLDRGLVTRYQLRHVPKPSTDEQIQDPQTYEATSEAIDNRGCFMPDPEPSPSDSTRYFYHVTSSEPPPKSWGRYTKKFNPKVYTVRVGSWYCSCEAFTMAAFSGPPTPVTLASGAAGTLAYKKWSKEEERRVWQHLENGEWVWGGAMLGVENPPICKHLFACVLAEHCGGLFMNHVKEVGLGFEEMVGKSVGLRTYEEKVDSRTPVRIKQGQQLAEDETWNGVE